MSLVAAGMVSLGWMALTACTGPSADAVALGDPPALAAVPPQDLCSQGGTWRRRVYVNITYESADPSWAVAMAQRELMHREGEATYVNAGDAHSSSSLQGRIPVGQDLDWMSQLEVGRVTNISNSDSPIQPELDASCERLAALLRAEELILATYARGGDREAAAVMLELHRNEVNNLRARIRSLLDESGRAQVNLYFNPAQ